MTVRKTHLIAFDVEADATEHLPGSIVAGIVEGLPEAWFSAQDGDDFWIADLHDLDEDPESHQGSAMEALRVLINGLQPRGMSGDPQAEYTGDGGALRIHLPGYGHFTVVCTGWTED